LVVLRFDPVTLLSRTAYPDVVPPKQRHDRSKLRLAWEKCQLGAMTYQNVAVNNEHVATNK
jgi:hypothetical protein